MTDPNGAITQREFAAWVAAHDHLHALDRAQMDKTERTLDKRLESMNEFRQALRDAQGSFVTRDMADIRHGAIDAKIDLMARERRDAIEGLEGRVERSELWISNLGGRTAGIAAAVGFSMSVIVIVIGVLLKVIP
jgi:hypothetical protein